MPGILVIFSLMGQPKTTFPGIKFTVLLIASVKPVSFWFTPWAGASHWIKASCSNKSVASKYLSIEK